MAPVEVDGQRAFRANYRVTAPGGYRFFVEPAPYWEPAEVEVEWKNDGSVKPPADAFVTQVIKADANGAFAYAMPRAGWWGFAALLEADEPMRNPEGELVPVETGALIWLHARDMR